MKNVETAKIVYFSKRQGIGRLPKESEFRIIREIADILDFAEGLGCKAEMIDWLISSDFTTCLVNTRWAWELVMPF